LLPLEWATLTEIQRYKTVDALLNSAKSRKFGETIKPVTVSTFPATEAINKEHGHKLSKRRRIEYVINLPGNYNSF
jgi:hypothetical protein